MARCRPKILDRLALTSSVPGLGLATPTAADREVFDAAHLSRFAAVLSRVAMPYSVDNKGKVTRTDYGATGIDAATGMVSTVRDIARFDAALDAGVPMSTSTLNQMWSQTIVGNVALPTGLGWFVQVVSTERLVWSFG